MKNREEYLASIYAKRDARLVKRKNMVGMALTALCIVCCFCAAAVVMPKMMKKTLPELATEVTVAVNNAEDTVNDQNSQIISNQYATMITHYPKQKTEDNNTAFAQGQKNFGYNESELMNQRVTVSKEEAGVEYDSAETEIAQGSEERENQEIPQSTTKVSADAEYTTEQISEVVYACLSENEKKAVEGIEPFVTVTRTSSGDEYYNILYKTDSGKIKITLNAENLELVQKSSSFGDISETTAAPQMIVTTPAYNPNS